MSNGKAMIIYLITGLIKKIIEKCTYKNESILF